MVQLVFVPTIPARIPEIARQAARNRALLFEHVLFDGAPLRVSSPDWHQLLAPLEIPAPPPALAGTQTEPDLEEAVLAQLAHEDPKAALDAVYAMLVDCADQGHRDLTTDEIDSFREASKLIADNDAKPAIEPTNNDIDFIAKLAEVVDPGNTRLAPMLRDAGLALAARARESVSTRLASTFQHQINPMIARVVGTMLIYFGGGLGRDAVRRLVAAEINKAFATAEDRPLVLMGHCIGGVILYDVLANPQACGLSPDVKVDALVTVGSQIGLLHAAGLTPPPGAASSAHLKAWLEVVDPSDILGVRATDGLRAPEIVEFDGVTGLLPTHTTYFKRPQFHARIRHCLKALELF